MQTLQEVCPVQELLASFLVGQLAITGVVLTTIRLVVFEGGNFRGLKITGLIFTIEAIGCFCGL